MSFERNIHEAAAISQGFKDGKSGRDPSPIMLTLGHRELYLEYYDKGLRARDSESLRIASKRI